MRITLADFTDPRVLELLTSHHDRAVAETAPGSAHALDYASLQAPDVKLWTVWDGDVLVGAGALKRLSDTHAEVKSMYVEAHARRRGVGSRMLRHLIESALTTGVSQLSLETGTWPYFAAARALYKAHGFEECAPFGNYKEDPNSAFLTLQLRPQPDPGVPGNSP